MSSFAVGDTRSPSAKPFVPSGDGARDAYMGQQHGRIQVEEEDTNSKMAGSRSAGTDITLTQRMISATGGSVLTSLLGKTPSSKQTAPKHIPWLLLASGLKIRHIVKPNGYATY
jgi:hypothetical protein